MKENYSETYKEFGDVLRKALKLSRACAGIPSPTGKHFYASVLFTKLCVTAVSLQKLAPSPKLLGHDAHWDYASACSLARNIVECYLIFYYFCVHDIDAAEWDARWRLFNLHDCLSRKKMFDSAGIAPEGKAIQVIKITINELKANSFFQSLSIKKQQHFLKGTNALFMTQDEIVKSYDGDVNEFRFIYRFLSNQVHSLPMSFYCVAEQERGRGVESQIEVGYTSLCLDTAGQYLEQAFDDYKGIFEKIKGVKI